MNIIQVTIYVQIKQKIFIYKAIKILGIIIKILLIFNFKYIDVIMKRKQEIFANQMKKLMNGFEQKHFGLNIWNKNLILRLKTRPYLKK